MRTTLDLPDDLMRSVKLHAVHTDRTLTDAIADLLRAGLGSAERQSSGAHHVTLPLVRNSRSAREDDLSPERIAEILSESDPV
ncbi:MAG: hypothetical protein QM607_01035 [Microbacterium sp.]